MSGGRDCREREVRKGSYFSVRLPAREVICVPIKIRESLKKPPVHFTGTGGCSCLKPLQAKVLENSRNSCKQGIFSLLFCFPSFALLSHFLCLALFYTHARAHTHSVPNSSLYISSLSHSLPFCISSSSHTTLSISLLPSLHPPTHFQVEVQVPASAAGRVVSRQIKNG